VTATVEELLARQRRLDKAIRRLRAFLHSTSFRGDCVSSRDVIRAVWGRTRCPDPRMLVMIWAWMDRYYPRVRSRPRHGLRVTAVWKVR